MTKLLLSLHVLAAILTVGPVAVAASMFLRFARPAPAGTEQPPDRSRTIAVNLHRVCCGYTLVGIAVPVFGTATAIQLGVLGSAWLVIAIALTVVAAVVLLTAVIPGQARMLSSDEPATAPDSAASRLRMATGIFNLLWATVVVLMIVRPGSTTGA